MEDSAPPWRVAQNPSLVGALVFATFNLYGIWWLGRTWAQIKQEDGDTRKRPVWHALAMLVPIYGFFRFHAHMRAISNLARAPIRLNPASMTLAWLVVSTLDSAGQRRESPFWVSVLSAALGGALFGWAQDALNAMWRSLPGGAVEGRAHPLHWVILMVGVLLYALVVLGSLTEG